MNRLLSLIIAVAGLILTLAPNAVAVSYNVQEVAFGRGILTVSAINNEGLVVGTEWRGDGSTAAFIWSATTGLNYLSPLPGYASASASGVNDKGQIVGFSRSATAPHTQHGTLWDGTTVTDLSGTLPGGEYTWYEDARAINYDGRVAGSAGVAGSGHAILWDKEAGLSDLTPGDTSVHVAAWGINDAGVVAGEYNYSQAFVWSAASGFQFISLPNQGNAIAYDINNDGAVVIMSSGTSTMGVPYVWRPGHDAVLVDTAAAGLETLSYADDINDLGQIVGWSGNSAFVWDPATGIHVLPLPQFTRYASAGCINDLGVIAGYSSGHLLLWTPVPEPSSLAALAIGLVPAGAIALKRKRRS